MLHRTSFAALAAFAALCASAGTASSTPAAARGKLVLVGASLSSVDAGRDGLYVMNADGSGLRQITHSHQDEQPHWSPDGRLIAFVEDDTNSGATVVVVRSDGSKRRVIGSGESSTLATLSAPDPWSPDGKRIAWTGCGGLCVFDLGSSRRTSISIGSDSIYDDYVQGFAWSPDGRRLAVVDQEKRFFVVDAAGGIVRTLSAKEQLESPAWSPDGEQIAFVAQRTLELVRATGGSPHALARNLDAYSAPAWSGDGRRLLYTDFDRANARSSVRVLNVATHTNTRVDEGDGIARWSPDGSMIAYGRLPFPIGTDQDVWIAPATGGSAVQLTGEFPTGIGYTDLDWAAGSVPAGPSAPPLDLLPLAATGELKLDDLVYDLGRAGMPDSVVYRTDWLCSYDAETTLANFNVWTPSTGQTATTSTDCQDWGPDSYGVTAGLAAWASEIDLNGNESLDVVRTGATDETPLSAGWETGKDVPDIGWRDSIGRVVSDGSIILFDTSNDYYGKIQLWRIADSGTTLHAVPVPVPADATGLIDADPGRIVVGTGRSSLAVLNTDGAVLSRIPVPAAGTVGLGGSLLAVATRTTLSVYDADSGALKYQLPLSRTTGVPRMLTVGAGYAVYASGIELHLLRLDNGNDRIVYLPGQDGPLQALLTTDGLFIAYVRGYDPQPGRILFVPASNLP